MIFVFYILICDVVPGERPYKCGECGKSFIEQSNLLAHKKLHKPAPTFPCKHCDKTFATKKQLDEHMVS